MKKLLLVFAFVLIGTLSYSQSFSNVKTEYSRIEEGTIGRESFTFSLSNSEIKIIDNDYNTVEKYGPLIQYKSGYEDGFYFVAFKFDIEAVNEMPALHSYYAAMKKKAYSFVSKTKGGEILYVKEFEIRNGKVYTKTFYTTEGFSDRNQINNK